MVKKRTKSSSGNGKSIVLACMIVGCLGIIYWQQQQWKEMLSLQDNNDPGKVIPTSSCPNVGSMDPPSGLSINIPAIKAQDKGRLDEIKAYTFEKYEKYVMSEPGVEHYTLLHWLTLNYGDCRHVVDIGTRYVASSLALGATGVPVKTFDIPQSRERQTAFRGKTEEEWQSEVKSKGIDITFHNLDLLSISVDELKSYMGTWLIMLDTFHKPDTTPFEREFLKRLVDEVQFKGIMLLDDIYFNSEMKKWWEEIKENASAWGFVAHDITAAGHATGTGMLDFTGRDIQVFKA